MNKIKLMIAGLLLVPTMAVGASLVSGDVVSAQYDVGSGVEAARGDNVPSDVDGSQGVITKAVNIMLYIIGIISVIVIIYAGIKYAISAGDTDKVTRAKNTLIYAIVGLIVAVFAYAIINWILKGIL